jgi:hypothetical protein
MKGKTRTTNGDEVQTGNACIVCWRSPTDRAHVVDRSLAPDPYSDPRRIVYLCREHHVAYDAHELDLLPYLEPRHRSELARAVEVFGLMGTLERVTGCMWTPDHEGTAIARDIARAGGLDVV